MQITSLIEAGPSRSRQEQLSNAINSKLIPGLDALRALAILLVLEYHFNNPLHGEIGPMGVEVFFVLSGFLITGILLKEYSRSGTIRLSEFYKRRAFRIFPTFYVCWILTTLFMVIDRVPELLSSISRIMHERSSATRATNTWEYLGPSPSKNSFICYGP